jgi:hypothetical protein
LEQQLLERFLGRVNAQPIDDDDERAQCATSVQSRIVDLLDSWQKISDDYHNLGVALQYQKYELDKPKPLMREMIDEDFESEHHRKFRVNRSLRDVEPSVNLFLKEQTGGFAKDGA